MCALLCAPIVHARFVEAKAHASTVTALYYVVLASTSSPRSRAPGRNCCQQHATKGHLTTKMHT